MRADNRGEGGIMALIALAADGRCKTQPHWRAAAAADRRVRRGAVLRRRGAHAGDLGALGGRRPARSAPRAFKPYVVPIAVGVLLGAVRAPGARHRGGRRAFGPVTLLWFVAIGAAGICGIVRAPAVLGGAEPAARACASSPGTASRRSSCSARSARRHRRRGALRRHGPLRQGRGAHRLVQPGGAGAGAELLRPGRAADRATRRRWRIPSTCCCPAGRSTRWWRSPRRRR